MGIADDDAQGANFILSLGCASLASMDITDQDVTDRTPSASLRHGDISSGLLEAASTVGVVGVDTETTGLDPMLHELRLIQVHVPGYGTEVIRFEPSGGVLLQRLLSSNVVTKVFHFATFDLGFLHRNYPVDGRKVACTKVAAKILWPNDPSAQRLTSLTERYLGFTLDKSLQVSDWSAETLTNAQINYAVADAACLPALYAAVTKELEAQGNLALAESCWRFIPTRVALTLSGLDDVFAY